MALKKIHNASDNSENSGTGGELPSEVCFQENPADCESLWRWTNPRGHSSALSEQGWAADASPRSQAHTLAKPAESSQFPFLDASESLPQQSDDIMPQQ